MQRHASTGAPRRRFLSTVLAGCGTVLIRPPCLKATEKLRTLRFIVVSDTHLGYRDQDRAGRQWDQTAAEIARSEGDLVLHLGDVVDGGRASQYPLYLATREKIGKPVHEIPGNHDPALPTRGSEFVHQRVWVPGWTEKVWIEPAFEWRFGSCGTRFRVQIGSGYWRTVHHPGRYETRPVRVWRPGHWVARGCN